MSLEISKDVYFDCDRKQLKYTSRMDSREDKQIF